MKNYLFHLQLFLFRFLLLIFLFSLSRGIFYLFNADYFGTLPTKEFFNIFFYGIRFDISALYYFNLPFIILSLIPGNFKNNQGYQRTLHSLFTMINALLLAVNFIDTKFFDFEHKRLTADIFNPVWLGEDFITLLPAFIKDYWYLLLLWFVFVYLLYRLYPKVSIKKTGIFPLTLRQVAYQSLLFILLMGIGLLGGRGGLQLKPLRVIHAAKYTTAKNIPLVLNTPFTIMKSIGAESFEVNRYFDTHTLDSIYSPIQSYSSRPKELNPNIVIIILESFSKEYVGYYNNYKGYTPFLDSLCRESLVFTRAYANGKRSIEALPSIIGGLPALTDNPYITSSFSSNKINTIPSLLNELGYQSAFFHGGKNGTMGFDQFANIAEFDHYFGMNEYPNPSDFDGNWGIYDEEYLCYVKDQLDHFPQPFFTTMFTLTSHHPYQIPSKYKTKFPKGNLNIHESIGYTDYALKKFFQQAQHSSWYQNTLFIITADHTAQSEYDYYNNQAGNYAIPMLLFHPKDTLFRGNRGYITQQTDIFPTIMEYCGYPNPFVAFGKSMLSDTTHRVTVNYMNGIYQLIAKNYLLQFDGKKSIAFYHLQEDPLLDSNIIHTSDRYLEYEKKLKAIIQSYQERLTENNLTVQN